jgi:hypothetical protein
VREGTQLLVVVMPIMAKCIFLTFIFLLALAMNAAVIDREREMVSLLYGVAAVNAFAIGLLMIWLASYFVRFKGAGIGVVGHAFVCLAAGVAFIGMGRFGLAERICMSPSQRLSEWVLENGACNALSLGSIGLGIFVLWPSAKLLYGITRRSTRSHAKTRAPV